MSLLAFGVGAVAVATLFPTAILRSVNATKMTKATIHRQNAEAFIDLAPDALVNDPDRDGNFRQHYDPADPAYAGNKYIVDPVGWEQIRRDAPGTPAQQLAAANRFGQTTGMAFLPRYNAINNRTAGISLNNAVQIVSSPDSWTQPFEAELTVSNLMPSSIDVAGISTADLAEVNSDTATKRITLFDGTGRFSHVRTITTITGNTVNWTAGQPLPTGFTPETARIEVRENQFTWLLTVRNANDPTSTTHQPSGRANVDVVVFFRRAFSTANETVFALTQPGGSQFNEYTVDASGSRPFLKKGAWICDVQAARWYRVQRVLDETSATPRIRLEDAPTGTRIRQAIFMPGVVEVYSLGVK